MSNQNAIFAAEPAIAGCVFTAPVGTPRPKLPTPFADLDSAFTELGDVGDDGFTEKTDRKTDKKRNFGGNVVKVTQSEFGITVEFTLLESLNADVLRAVYGDQNVTVLPATETSGTIIEVRKNSKRLLRKEWVIDTVDTSLGAGEANPARWRSYIGEGQIIDTGDVKIVHTDTIEYKVTLECFEDHEGQFMDTWTDDGVVGKARSVKNAA